MHLNISMGDLEATLQRTMIQKRVTDTKIIPTLCLVNNERHEHCLDLQIIYFLLPSSFFLRGKDGIQRHLLLYHII